jgi:hypothetical protein
LLSSVRRLSSTAMPVALNEGTLISRTVCPNAPGGVSLWGRIFEELCGLTTGRRGGVLRLVSREHHMRTALDDKGVGVEEWIACCAP